jgi:5-methylcytosine-specific restriction endonuclease McrA
MATKKASCGRWDHVKRVVEARRSNLIQIMGGTCVRCGSSEKLEFHHVRKRTWVARNVSRWRRMIFYEDEYRDGLLELLCSYCNKVAGKPPDPDAEPDF